MKANAAGWRRLPPARTPAEVGQEQRARRPHHDGAAHQVARTRRRSRLNSGRNANTSSQPSETRRAQPGSDSPRLPGARSATSGTKNSTSRIRFRANTASAVSAPPCASTTRIRSARLPGVAPWAPALEEREVEGAQHEERDEAGRDAEAARRAREDQRPDEHQDAGHEQDREVQQEGARALRRVGEGEAERHPLGRQHQPLASARAAGGGHRRAHAGVRRPALVK